MNKYSVFFEHKLCLIGNEKAMCKFKENNFLSDICKVGSKHSQQRVRKESMNKNEKKQDCSYQVEALDVLTAF